MHLQIVDDSHPYSAYRHSEGLTVEIDFGSEKGKWDTIEEKIAQLEPEIEKIIVNVENAPPSTHANLSEYGFQPIQETPLVEIYLRRAVRAILCNPAGEILLMRIKSDPTKEEQKNVDSFWLTPGGKIEIGESSEIGLAREIQEETGITNIHIERFLFAQERPASWGRPYRLFSRYYLVRTPEITVTMEHLMPYERDVVLEYKWWSLHDLLHTTEILAPQNLAQTISSQVIAFNKDQL